MLTTSTSPTIPFNNCDTPWYMDFGATHHFTPKFGNLIDPCVFTGEEQAMVGDGKSIGISRIGNAKISSLMKLIHLKHVLHITQISKQLISVTKLCYDNQLLLNSIILIFL